MVEVEKTHVSDEEQKLVKTYVLIGLFLSFLFSTNTSSLDIPNFDWYFLEVGLHFDFFIDCLYEGCLPPVNVCPNMMIFDEFVQLNFAILFLEMVSHGEYHEHFGVVCI